MKNHEYADIFPMMNEVDFNNLKKDIQENGFDENRAIILFEDKILDGRNRYKACEELKIKPVFIEYEGKNPLYYVISNNLNRRHLNESQRAVISIRLINTTYGGAIYSSKNGSSKDGLISREKASEVMNVSTALIDRAKEISEKMPEEIARIERGEVTIGNVYGELKRREAETPFWLRFLDVWTFKADTGEGISNLPPEIIQNLLYYYTEEGDLIVDCFAGSGQTYTIAKEMKRKCVCSDINPLKPYIINRNIDEGFPKEANNCNLIFLDPPYWNMVDYGEGWSDLSLSEFYKRFELLALNCEKVLKKGGKVALIIMPLKTGEDYFDLGFECYKILQKRFKIVQRLCVPLIRNWSLDARLQDTKENKEILTASLRDLIVFEK